jgi:hypothetical protein
VQKKTLNENLSMAMYALVHKLLQKKSKINPNPKEIILCNRGKLQATFIYFSTDSESMKHITKLS